MSTEDEAFAEAFSDGKETRAQEPLKAQETPPKEEAPPKVEETAQIQAEAPPQQPPPATEPEKTRVDPEQFKGYLEEREKRQEAERRLRELEAKNSQLQQQLRPQEPPPDPWENPQAALQHQREEISREMLGRMVQQSRFIASRDFGEDVVNAAIEWAGTLPDAHQQSFLQHPSPVHAAIEAHRQHQAAQLLQPHGYDLEKLKAQWLEEYKAQNQAPAVTQAQAQQQPALNLPPKVAGEGGHVGQQPKQSEGDFFRSVFTR